MHMFGGGKIMNSAFGHVELGGAYSVGECQGQLDLWVHGAEKVRRVGGESGESRYHNFIFHMSKENITVF